MDRKMCTMLVTLAMVLIAPCYITSATFDNFMDEPNQAQFDDEYHRNVREAFLKLDIPNSPDPKLIMEKVRRLAESNDDHKQVYKTLLMLTDHDSIDGLEPLMKLLKSIRAQTKKNQVLLGRTYFFLQHFKRSKFHKWASMVQTEFPEDRKVDILESFDLVFREALRVDKQINLKRQGETIMSLVLWHMLKDFDIVTGDMDSSRMLKYLNSGKSSSLKANDDYLKPFKSFMNRSCRDLKRFELQLDIVSMARVFDYRDIISHKFARMREYYRMCLAWKRPDKHDQILENVQEQMTASGRAARKARTLRKNEYAYRNQFCCGF